MKGLQMPEQTTCGQGLAEHSLLPIKLGELTEAMALQLKLHTRALDLGDENSRKENSAYQGLVQKHREVATRLRALGEAMAGYRDLPEGKHDMQVMTSRELVAAFENLVHVEQELLTLLDKQVGEHQQMLGMMVDAARDDGGER
jgi:hypothetical protein